MNDEDEKWRLMHILRGETAKHCGHPCSDDLCLRGCLNQQAKLFRPEIMRGIKLVRENGSDRFPLSAVAAFNSHRSCYWSSTKTTCQDPVCTVAGCMDVPGWRFRDLIRMSREEELMVALKK